MKISAKSFFHIGFHLLERPSHTMTESNIRIFKANFGTAPEIVEIVWSLLSEEEKWKPENLLLTFYFMKVYKTENVNATSCHVDEKTFRKWSWNGIDSIADLEEQVVRSLS